MLIKKISKRVSPMGFIHENLNFHPTYKIRVINSCQACANFLANPFVISIFPTLFGHMIFCFYGATRNHNFASKTHAYYTSSIPQQEKNKTIKSSFQRCIEHFGSHFIPIFLTFTLRTPSLTPALMSLI